MSKNPFLGTISHSRRQNTQLAPSFDDFVDEVGAALLATDKQQKLKQIGYDYGVSLKLAFEVNPVAKDHKSRIITWVEFWPLTTPWWILEGFVKEFGLWIYYFSHIPA